MAGRKSSGPGSVEPGATGTEPGTKGIDGTGVSGPSQPIEPDSALNGASIGERDASGTEFDPAIHSGARNSDGNWTKRRGRKASGSGPKPKASKADLKDAVEGLTKTLVILHAGIASVTNTPELEIDGDEGRMLAAASANVMEQFDLKPDPKVQAIVGLVVACGTVYGPRAYMIRKRLDQQAHEKRANRDGVGTAGIYAPNGEAQGTTEFQHVN